MTPSSRMKSWYEQGAQKKRWGQDAATSGLYPTEKHLIEKHFKPKGRLLNIGAGGGREALALAADHALVAIDFSRDFCLRCKENLQSKSLLGQVLEMDAGHLGFLDGTFDSVVMVGQLIGHIRGRENRVAALSQVRRVLKPGGRALVSTNAIELGWKFRFYFGLANGIRKFYNPYSLEPDDAFLFKADGRRSLFKRSKRPVFHWYRTSEFLKDAAAAGLHCVEFLRRYEHEKPSNIKDRSIGGETFYVLISK